MSVSQEEYNKLLERVKELETGMTAAMDGSKTTKMVLPQSKLMDFPNKPGLEARCFIEQAEARFAQGSFATIESKIGAIKNAMSKSVTALTWLDMLPEESLDT